MFFFAVINCFGQTKQDTLDLLDFEIGSQTTNKAIVETSNYFETVSHWSTFKDVYNWVKYNFCYDFARAQLLANNSNKKNKISIYSPEELWIKKKGICVDLSRFAYETIQLIDSSAISNYLKIEFEPLEINGSRFVNHWLILLKEKDEFYFFADSKRPDILDGPYESVQEFIKKYEKFRGRKINSYALLNSYKKTTKKKRSKTSKVNSLSVFLR